MTILTESSHDAQYNTTTMVINDALRLVVFSGTEKIVHHESGLRIL